VNFIGANLSESDMRGTNLAGANLEHATLSGTDLSRSELSGCDLSEAELRHANLSRVNLSGANLSGANLRWADLSGANLRWADFSEAKLSGSNLLGADLSNANLVNASFVHADLTQANLIRVEWVGADLSGATLTGIKLYGVSRYNLKTEGITCEWVDLSPYGDRTQIYRFSAEEAKKFFNQTPPTVRIIIDAPLDQNANYALAATYQQIANQIGMMQTPPSIKVGYRRTELSFKLDNDYQIFSSAYIAIIPFKNASSTQKNIITLMKMLQAQAINSHSMESIKQVKQLSSALSQTIHKVNELNLSPSSAVSEERVNFFDAPTQMLLTNSSDRSLQIYYDQNFGKRLINTAGSTRPAATGTTMKATKFSLPTVNVLVDFVSGFYYLES
jgi:hypothetical protein